ncbi:hypothetical protein C3432_20965 [Citrobacter amalonaticus]|uniref:DUF2628 domain-containing protein n=1 Tax=Citrobacter amalonaticus TaxID=35703 RepID=A0A2S4RV39_CITAM|nr:DUF2628 domain-containing protein [Citrobacter amalonaticus]POT55527.1 hypothetical protein C3432_20965 [Citrobacter amalonaticus]POT73738.1 hypothetical protein C3436_18430 [Citrobacter amalonaticus]POU63963.1 hypothetical protein C3430_17365 [Citrobacter amalonaticus]POV03596.1 hypothetical protein C3424_20280 [Citrobacter amalonaticus]
MNKDTKQAPQKWLDRFSLFEKYGSPSSPEYQNALYSVGFTERTRYSYNFLAFLFGIVYFCALGLWRKTLSLFGILLGLSYMYSSIASHAYYLKINLICKWLRNTGNYLTLHFWI